MKRFLKVFWPWLAGPLFWLLAGLVAFAMWGCRSVEYMPVETVRTDSVYLNRVERDSVYVLDSVLVERGGDTVYLTRYRYVCRDRVVRDTAYMEKVDTVRVPVPVERKLSRWEQAKMDYGGFAMVAVTVFVLVGFGKMVYKLRK